MPRQAETRVVELATLEEMDKKLRAALDLMTDAGANIMRGEGSVAFLSLMKTYEVVSGVMDDINKVELKPWKQTVEDSVIKTSPAGHPR